jgi:hypothetical protein
VKVLLFIHLLFGNVQSDYFSVFFNQHIISIDSIAAFLPRKVTPEMLADISIKAKNEQNGILIQQFPSGIYATQSCELDLFRWNGSEWVNLYEFDASGHNCGSYFFEYDSIIHNYGGYGFWHRNSQTLFFDVKDGGWGLIPTNNIPLDYSTGFTTVVDDSLYCLGGIYVNQDTKRFDFVRDGGFIQNLGNNNWKRFYWERYTNDEFGESGNVHDPSFDLRDYTVFGGTDRGVKGFLIFEKASKKLWYLNMYHNELYRSPFYTTEGNRLIFIDHKRGFTDLNFDRLKSKRRLLAEITFESHFEISNKQKRWILTALTLIIFLGIVIYQQQIIQHLKTNGANSAQKFQEIDQLIEKLKKYSGQNLETNQLDQLLEISSELSPEGIRGRRSKLISEINNRHNMTEGENLISRKRSDTDKRFYAYQIQA